MKQNKDTVILVDIDDTIENLCEVWCEILNERYGTSVHYTQVNEWDISKFFPELTAEQIYAPLHEEETWYRLRPLEGAQKYLKAMMDDGFQVFLCTTTDYRNDKDGFGGSALAEQATNVSAHATFRLAGANPCDPSISPKEAI